MMLRIPNMPHWELWLHLYRGELFNAPTRTTGVRKPVRAGCLNLVLNTGKTERPREYTLVGLSSNHAGWDSQWFYLRNDDDLLPAYTGRLITERPENWTYGVVQVHQSRLDPLLDALKKLRMEGLSAALVLSAVHHRRVLPPMSRPLRMDEMGPGASSQDLEACRMSNEAPADDEVAAQVRAAVASDFQPEHVNGFPMRPDAGSIDLVSSFLVYGFNSGFPSIPFSSLSLFTKGPLDVRSSRPPVKEDGVDRDKRHQFAEKQKSAKDIEKKEKKKKNLDRQSLEARRAKSRRRGEPQEQSPSKNDGGDSDDDSDDSEGMASRLDRILEGPPRGDVDAPRTGAPKEGPGGSHRPRADTPPMPAPSRSVLHHQPPPDPKVGGRAKPQAMGPLTRGRAAAIEKGDTGRRSASPGARQVGDARSRPAPTREGPGASTWGCSRPTGRGTGRRAVLPVG